MAVGIEPQTVAEARLPHEVLFGHTLEIVEEPAVRFLQLSQDLGERQVRFCSAICALKESMPPYWM
jgi:hypothetical protein